MNTMLDDAYNCLCMHRNSLSFDDLFHFLVEKYDLNKEQFIENKNDLYIDISMDSRFRQMGKKWFLASQVLQREHNRDKEYTDLDAIKTKKDFFEVFGNAINEETTHLYKSRKKYVLKDGQLVSYESNREKYTYYFNVADNFNFIDDQPIFVYWTVDGEEYHDFGNIIISEEDALMFSCGTDLRNYLKHIEISTNSSAILKILNERFLELKTNNKKFLTDLMLNGMSRISCNSITKGQDAALKHAMNERITFIWGPPGTGKTETLANIAIDFLKRGKRVLMVSQSNVSVDGAMLRVIHNANEALQSKIMVRYGFPKDEFLKANLEYNTYKRVLHQDSKQYKEYQDLIHLKDKVKKDSKKRKEIAEQLKLIREKFRKAEQELVKKSDFVATTITKALMDKAVYSSQFDLVLFDEASMAYVPQVIFAASLSKESFVCLGDYQQLPSISVVDNSILSKDIFRYVGIEQAVRKGYGHDWLVMLNVQRRMHPTIASFLSHNMYFDELISAEGMAEKTECYSSLLPNNNPFGFIDLSGCYSVCTKTYDRSYINLFSAFVSINLAKLYSKKMYPIGIITPYNAQARLIRNMIKGLNLRNVECSTVHQFQGSEKPVIIFDAVDCYIRSFAHDLLTSNRLVNVAISRAKGKFVFVGNKNYLNEKVPKSKELLTNLLNYYDRNHFVTGGKEILNCFVNDDKEKNSIRGGLSDHLYNQYINDLESCTESICIDLNGTFLSENVENQIYSILSDLWNKGIKIILRYNPNTPVSDKFVKFSKEEFSVLNTATIIDKKIVWLGMPARDIAFKTAIKDISISLDCAFKINSSSVANSVYAFLEMSAPKNDEVKPQKTYLERKCPVCKNLLIQKAKEEVYCSNNTCQYKERVVNSTKTSSDILSVYMGDDIEVAEDYLMCHIVSDENIETVSKVTLRNSNGLMKTIYKVEKIIEINPRFIDAESSVFKKNSKEYYKLRGYLDELSNIKNRGYYFLYLKKDQSFRLNKKILGKKNEWIL